jgi:hypothetical protein
MAFSGVDHKTRPAGVPNPDHESFSVGTASNVFTPYSKTGLGFPARPQSQQPEQPASNDEYRPLTANGLPVSGHIRAAPAHSLSDLIGAGAKDAIRFVSGSSATHWRSNYQRSCDDVREDPTYEQYQNLLQKGFEHKKAQQQGANGADEASAPSKPVTYSSLWRSDYQRACSDVPFLDTGRFGPAAAVHPFSRDSAPGSGPAGPSDGPQPEYAPVLMQGMSSVASAPFATGNHPPARQSVIPAPVEEPGMDAVYGTPRRRLGNNGGGMNEVEHDAPAEHSAPQPVASRGVPQFSDPVLVGPGDPAWARIAATPLPTAAPAPAHPAVSATPVAAPIILATESHVPTPVPAGPPSDAATVTLLSSSASYQPLRRPKTAGSRAAASSSHAYGDGVSRSYYDSLPPSDAAPRPESAATPVPAPQYVSIVQKNTDPALGNVPAAAVPMPVPPPPAPKPPVPAGAEGVNPNANNRGTGLEHLSADAIIKAAKSIAVPAAGKPSRPATAGGNSALPFAVPVRMLVNGVYSWVSPTVAAVLTNPTLEARVLTVASTIQAQEPASAVPKESTPSVEAAAPAPASAAPLMLARSASAIHVRPTSQHPGMAGAHAAGVTLPKSIPSQQITSADMALAVPAAGLPSKAPGHQGPTGTGAVGDRVVASATTIPPSAIDHPAVAAKLAAAKAEFKARMEADPPRSALVEAAKRRHRLVGKVGSVDTESSHAGAPVGQAAHVQYVLARVGPAEADVTLVKQVRTEGGKVVTRWASLDADVAARLSRQRWDKLASPVVF